MASALRESVELEMRLRGFSPRTHESYIHALKERWMGHGALVTTGRYMHVRAEHMAKVKSPLDTLYDEE